MTKEENQEFKQKLAEAMMKSILSVDGFVDGSRSAIRIIWFCPNQKGVETIQDIIEFNMGDIYRKDGYLYKEYQRFFESNKRAGSERYEVEVRIG